MNFDLPLPGSGDAGQLLHPGNEIVFEVFENFSSHLVERDIKYLNVSMKQWNNQMLLFKALMELSDSSNTNQTTALNVVDSKMMAENAVPTNEDFNN